MKTTREVFIIMRAGKIDKRDHEIAKKTQFCQFVNNTSYGFPRDAGTRKGPGGQTLLKGTDKILIMLKSIPWNLEGQLHSSCAKFLPIIFLA